jgi:hypothetical protein
VISACSSISILFIFGPGSHQVPLRAARQEMPNDQVPGFNHAFVSLAILIGDPGRYRRAPAARSHLGRAILRPRA